MHNFLCICTYLIFCQLTEEWLKAKGNFTLCAVFEFFLDKMRTEGRLGPEVTYSFIAGQVPHLAATLPHCPCSINWAITLNSIVTCCQEMHGPADQELVTLYSKLEIHGRSFDEELFIERSRFTPVQLCILEKMCAQFNIRAKVV